MFVSLLCLSLVTNQVPGEKTTAESVSLEGTWTVISLEMDGKPKADAIGKIVTVKDNIFTCTGKDGKQGMIFKIEFAKNGTMSVTELAKEDGIRIETPGESKNGVYVLTNNYLAICVHDESAAASTSPQQKSKCTLLLQRDAARRDR